jgi:hypothetical protein
MSAPGRAQEPGATEGSAGRTWPWVAAVGALLGVALATGPPWWFHLLSAQKEGCATYQIYAEDRGSMHTAVWSAPTTTSSQVATLSTIASIAVNGWQYGTSMPAPDVSVQNSRIWFRLADGSGWVPFGTVRAYPTGYDPTGEDPTHVQAAAPANCEVR